jgi:tetratricopeptide (TPR) repeat protein
MAHYDRAIEIKPTYWEAHYNRGNLLLRGGQTAEAVEAYRRSVAINPDFPEGWQNLAAALARSGSLDEARACLARAEAARAKQDSRR